MPDLPVPTSFGPVFRSYLRGNPPGLRTLEKELGLRKVTLRRIVEGKTVEARVVHKIITWIFGSVSDRAIEVARVKRHCR